jgi:hypothetical protein
MSKSQNASLISLRNITHAFQANCNITLVDCTDNAVRDPIRRQAGDSEFGSLFLRNPEDMNVLRPITCSTSRITFLSPDPEMSFPQCRRV